jgi:hypothetical protein
MLEHCFSETRDNMSEIDFSEFRLKKENNPFYAFEKWFWKLPHPNEDKDTRSLINKIVFGDEKKEKVST